MSDGHGVAVHRSALSEGLEYQQDQRTLEDVVSLACQPVTSFRYLTSLV